ncbi:ABC transporter permease [Acidisoma cellulosilytica]|uniref:ABC transporter permease n=1 Tax=Acidisoma cellulosilyticum TaxID=2802395 RepID=A0A964E3H9_9PROT|nr:ABC transporter permease [Acidisoma cellulosilyticum]MCB8879918.1 ABC transporter permease [Acidisoma cellulosilyticum]
MNGFLGDWIGAIPVFAAPYLLATTGLIINERAGVMNLGAEGIMSMGAVAAVIAMLSGLGLPAAILLGCVAAVGMTLLFALLAVVLRLEQVLSGLVIFAFGVGLSGVIGDSFANQPIKALGPVFPSAFAGMPRWLAHLLDQDPLTYFAFILPFIVWWVMERTELGLRLRSVGENAPAADAAGVNVMAMRIGAVLVGGIVLGLAGAHLSLVGSQVWVTGMVSGRGWIAVALVTFSRWNTLRAIGAAVLFGAVQAVIPLLLSSGLHVPIYLIQMMPYLATIAVLAASGMGRLRASAQPEDLARPFLREERR